MKHMKKIIVPAVPEHIKEALDFTSCDLCGEKMNTYKFEQEFNVNEATIEHRIGNTWPDCGNTTTTSFDVCGKCFVGKVIPWMEAQGAKPEVTESDW
jgi:hypothetical protein